MKDDTRKAVLERQSVLLIFVDGLPFADVDLTVPKSWSRHPHIPTLGYSVNIEAELFAGKSADDIGWFCEWNLAQERPRWQTLSCRFASVFDRSEHFDYAAHRLLDRLFGEPTFNVPMRSLPVMRRSGLLPYENGFGHPTIFSEYGIDILMDGNELFFKSDADAVAAATKLIRGGVTKLFIPLVELDAISHAQGLTSPMRSEHLGRLRANIDRLYAAVQEQDPGALCIVLSDHGFSDVTESYDVDIPKLAHATGGRSHVTYMVESTLVRVWCGNPVQREEMSEELNKRDYGHTLDATERQRYSLSSPIAGDIVFVADEGVTFVPCTMTKRTVSAGMHGYLPESPSQHGLVCTSEPVFDHGSLNSMEFYRRLTD